MSKSKMTLMCLALIQLWVMRNSLPNKLGTWVIEQGKPKLISDFSPLVNIFNASILVTLSPLNLLDKLLEKFNYSRKGHNPSGSK